MHSFTSSLSLLVVSLGVYLAWLPLADWVSAPTVNYAVTVPGPAGYLAAFLAEVAISFGVMAIVLWSSNRESIAKYTGVLIGVALVVYITLEAPLSGMSMNPARTVGSAVPAQTFKGLWIYFVAPLIGMFAAAEIYLWSKGTDAVRCAKLHHTHDVRCIFKCGYAMGKPLDQPTTFKGLNDAKFKTLRCNYHWFRRWRRDTRPEAISGRQAGAFAGTRELPSA